MTCTQQARRMHADIDIHFGDTFDAYNGFEKERWLPHFRPSDFDKSLTPPPDMSGSHPINSTYYQPQNGYSHGLSSQQAWRAPVTSYVPREVSNAEFARNGVTTEPSSRNISPTFQSQPAVGDESYQRLQKRESHGGAIAPSFQIPKSVNDSGGSLSELAAQVSLPIFPTT